ncbi:MAG TPA: helix-turn-helix domain-containing protein [Acidimicrobiales bacterium]|jgi:AcrR family transcriptional regulator
MRSTIDGLTFTERARRIQIVHAAIGLIAEVGYAQASVAKIAERARTAKSVVHYHFVSKDGLVAIVATQIYLAAAKVMLPAIEAEETATNKLRAYIRANGMYINENRSDALVLLDIWTSFRTASGQRLDDAMAAAAADGLLPELDPASIFELGQRNGEFRPFDRAAMSLALRQAIDGAVLLVSRDTTFNIANYCEELVTLFDRATRPAP